MRASSALEVAFLTLERGIKSPIAALYALFSGGRVRALLSPNPYFHSFSLYRLLLMIPNFPLFEQSMDDKWCYLSVPCTTPYNSHYYIDALQLVEPLPVVSISYE